MGADALRRAHAEIVDQHGPWVGYNLDLGQGVFTIGENLVGTAEMMIQATVQMVVDAAGSLEGLRVLDLGAHEGGYAIALALQGAEVVAVEGRPQHVAKARFAAEVLGLNRMSVVEANVTDGCIHELGEFDIILCFGLLYHLPSEAAMDLCTSMYQICRRFVAVRSAVALRPNRRVTLNGREYRGREYREDTQQSGASIDNCASFFFTRSSLIQLLTDVGFCSVVEPLAPVVPGMLKFADSVTLIAWSGSPVPPLFLPAVARGQVERFPERRLPPGLGSAAHRAQGWPWSWRDRLRHEFASFAFGPRRRL